MTLHILASSKGGEGKGGDFFYIYIIYIYISSFKLLIVCLDYQNHFAVLPAAGRPQPWSYPPPAPAVPLKPTMQPTRRPLWAPSPGTVPQKALAVPLGPWSRQPLDHLGFTVTMFSPYHALLPSSGRRKPKDLQVGVGKLSASPFLFYTPLTPQPRETLLIPEKTIER